MTAGHQTTVRDGQQWTQVVMMTVLGPAVELDTAEHQTTVTICQQWRQVVTMIEVRLIHALSLETAISLHCLVTMIIYMSQH